MTKFLKYITIASFISCTAGLNKVPDINKDYCKNMTLLFAPTDTSNIFIINDLNVLDHTTNESLKSHYLNRDQFGIRLRNKFIVKIEIPYKKIACPKYSAIKITLNQSGLLAFNMNIIAIDSIKFWLHRKFPNKNTYDLDQISLDVATSVSKDSLDKVLLKIIDGYTLIYSDLAKENFGKNICALSQKEINHLRNLKPFRLVHKDPFGFEYPND